MCGSNIQRMLSCPKPSRLPLVTVTFLRGLTHTCNYLEARNRLRHPILVHHLEQLMSIITQCPPQSSVSSEASFKATPSSASGSSSKASSSTSTAPAISNSLVKRLHVRDGFGGKRILVHIWRFQVKNISAPNGTSLKNSI